MEIDFDKLSDMFWAEEIQRIARPVKAELHGSRGFIRAYKEKTEPDRKAEIEAAVASFGHEPTTLDLDNRINGLADKCMEINEEFETSICYDHVQLLALAEWHQDRPLLTSITAYLSSKGANPRAANRLQALLARYTTESLVQARKTNAGTAAEHFVRALLLSAGLLEAEHYRRQYKSKKGSDTDFTFPFVENHKDQDVELFLAVQASSNDRTRLVSNADAFPSPVATTIAASS